MAGSDDIAPRIIKECIHTCIIVEPLCDISDKSLSQGVVPSKLKLAKVIPVYKKNDSKCIENYIPIALLPTRRPDRSRYVRSSRGYRQWKQSHKTHVQINVEVEVWGNLISGNRHYICMKIEYFGQSLIIDLSEIDSPAKQTYLAYISCPASEVRTCKLHIAAVRE